MKAALESESRLGRMNTAALHFVFLSGGTEHIQHLRAVGTGLKGVRHIGRRAPKISDRYAELLPALNTHAAAVQQHAPLLLRMRMQKIGRAHV